MVLGVVSQLSPLQAEALKAETTYSLASKSLRLRKKIEEWVPNAGTLPRESLLSDPVVFPYRVMS